MNIPLPSFVPQPWAGTDTPALEWLYATGSFPRALAYSQLYWPQFIEHENCIFLAGAVTDAFAQWMQHTGGDKQRVEATLNHRHIADLFHTKDYAQTHDMLIALGRILREMWQAKLHQDFPGRQFEITFSDYPSAEATDYQITFFQSNRPA